MSSKKNLPSSFNNITFKQHDVFIDLYKHHIDAFLKMFFMYLAVIGIITGFIFKTQIPYAAQLILSSTLCIGTFISTWGCIVGLRIIISLERSFLIIQKKLKTHIISFQLGKIIFVFFTCVSAILFFGTVAILYVILKRDLNVT